MHNMSNNKNHLVYNDNTFGYPIREMNGRFIRMAVMAVDIEKGGDPTLIGYDISADASHLRIPDSTDYERFKIKE